MPLEIMSDDGLADIPDGEEWFSGFKVPDSGFRYFSPLQKKYRKAGDSLYDGPRTEKQYN